MKNFYERTETAVNIYALSTLQGTSHSAEYASLLRKHKKTWFNFNLDQYIFTAFHYKTLVSMSKNKGELFCGPIFIV